MAFCCRPFLDIFVPSLPCPPFPLSYQNVCYFNTYIYTPKCFLLLISPQNSDSDGARPGVVVVVVGCRNILAAEDRGEWNGQLQARMQKTQSWNLTRMLRIKAVGILDGKRELEIHLEGETVTVLCVLAEIELEA